MELMTSNLQNWATKHIAKKTYFPLNSQADVERAVRFHKWVPDDQRLTFYKELNSAIKRLEMTVEIPDDSYLKRVVHPDHFTVSEFWQIPVQSQDIMWRTTQLVDHITTDCSFKQPDKIGQVLHLIQKDVVKNGYKSIFNAVDMWFDYLIDLNPSDFIDEIMASNVFSKLYDMINELTQNVYEFFSYVDGRDSNVELLFGFIEDIRRSMYDDIVDANGFKHGTCELLRLLTTEKTRRYIIHLYRSVQVELLSNHSPKDEVFDWIDKIETEIASLYDVPTYPPFDFNLGEIINRVDGQFPLIESIKVLESVKIEQKNQLNIIERYNSNSVTSVTESMSPHVVDVRERLEKKVYYENVKAYSKRLSLKPSTMFALNHLPIVSDVSMLRTIDNEQLTLVTVNKGVCIVADGTKEGEIKLIELTDGEEIQNDFIDNVTSHPSEFNPSVTSLIHTITLNKSAETVEDSSLTEGVTFDEEGGFVFRMKPKTSYMDQYAENHKIIVQNAKVHNYDGIKTNLAFLFTLINNIERNVIYSKKTVSDKVRQDAEKARMFAINDFKTYLNIVHSNDPSFNFTTYYEQSDYGKIVFGFKKEEIVGIKRLFQTIILK